MGYSGTHEASNLCSGTLRKRTRSPRSGAALQRRLRSAPMPDPSGKLPRTIPSEDSPQFGMWLADGQERHPCLQRAWSRRPHARLLAPQARPRRFRRGKRRSLAGDAPPLPEGVRVRLKPLDFGDGRRGCLREGAHPEAGLGRDRTGHFSAPSRSGMAQSQKVDHFPRPTVRKKKRRRDRL
jgi:hypothetical protein